MEARFSNDASSFKRIIDAVKDIVTEVNLDCNSNGIELQAMDSSHVALVFFRLDAGTSFSHYKCDQSHVIGINISSLQKVLKSCNNEDILTINYDSVSQKLRLLFESKNGSRISDFSISLMDIDDEKLSIPESHHKTNLTMPSQEFARICRDFKELGDVMEISSDCCGIKFSLLSDIASGNITIMETSMSDEQQVTINKKESTKASFSLKYLSLFSKGISLSPTVNIYISDDLPLLVEYIFNGGVLKYYMAPKVDDY